jgi:hypothetical protein
MWRAYLMSECQLKTPVAYIVFNRPSQTRATFASIRAQQPRKLLLIADGPRLGHPTDAERCKEVREIIAKIDWPCEVYRNFSDTNLGCKLRVVTGLDWVFHQVDQAIILEDDCLPHPDFYNFCEILLNKYKDDHRIAVVTGDNFQQGNKRGNGSYYFSIYPHCWGWATWKRSWLTNDSNISFWPQFKVSEHWTKLLTDKVAQNYWAGIFDRVFARQFESTWDYQWLASVWYQGGLTATPNVNLVSNIGFGIDGTHTIAQKDGLPTYSIGPLIHPTCVAQNQIADRYVFDHEYGGYWQRIPRRFLFLPFRILRKIYGIFQVR